MPRSAAKSVPETYFRYLPVSPLDKAWGLYVTTAGYVKIDSEMDYPPPGHPERYALSWETGRVLDEYQLHYFPRGTGVFESKPGGRRTIEAGDFFLLFPGTWHRYAPQKKTGWDEYWIGFKGDQMNELVQHGFFSAKKPVFKPRVEHGALDRFSDIFIQLRTEPIGFMQVIAAHSMQMLAGVLAGSGAHPSSARAAQIIRAAKNRLRGGVDRDVDMHELAQELGVGYAWLRRTFRRYTGLPPHQYHLQLRLNKAMQLLANSGCTVKEAAKEAGYTDEYYFSRLFKLKTGRSPEAWKRLALGHRHKAAQ
jgi:AraC-like DNA-binding protein